MKLNMKQRRSLAGWCFVSPWVLGGHTSNQHICHRF